MDLKDFIKKTLQSIVYAVNEAGFSEKRIAPPLEVPGEDDGIKGQFFTETKDGLQPVFMVEFDVAVTASDTKSTEGGGGIKVLELVRAEGKKSAEVNNSTVSRVKFQVPVRISAK
jgi:hypothetical protein